jgi:hypothetical protein
MLAYTDNLVGGANYAGRLVNPNYLLMDWNRREELDHRTISNGFVRLGTSNWERPNYIDGYYIGRTSFVR